MKAIPIVVFASIATASQALAVPLTFVLTAEATSDNGMCGAAPAAIQFVVSYDDALEPSFVDTAWTDYGPDPSIRMTIAVDGAPTQGFSDVFVSVFDDHPFVHDGIAWGGTPDGGFAANVSLEATDSSLYSTMDLPPTLALADFDLTSWFYREAEDTPTGCFREGIITAIESVIDADGDHYLAAASGGDDCDDADPAVNPGIVEDESIVDGKDQDCDGADGPTISGFTLALGAGGTVVATSATVPGLVVTYPPGTTFPPGTAMTVSTGAGVTSVALTGAVMPAGTKKKIQYSLTPAYKTYGGFGGVFGDSSLARGCLLDSGITVSPGATNYSSCAFDDRWSWYFDIGNYVAGSWRVIMYVDRRGVTAKTNATSAPWHLEVADLAVDISETIVRTGGTETWSVPARVDFSFLDLSHTQLLLFDDTDHDGVPDADERAAGTDPELADSDGDGASDGDEQVLGTDPLDAADFADPDADGDGLTAFFEELGGTDPDRFDSDGDGVGDLFERLDGTDPTDPGDRALQDTDSDGADDRSDNCPGVTNADQADGDGDGVGTACDPDEGGGDDGDTAEGDVGGDTAEGGAEDDSDTATGDDGDTSTAEPDSTEDIGPVDTSSVEPDTGGAEPDPDTGDTIGGAEPDIADPDAQARKNDDGCGAGSTAPALGFGVAMSALLSARRRQRLSRRS